MAVVRQTYLIIELPSPNSIGSIGKVVWKESSRLKSIGSINKGISYLLSEGGGGLRYRADMLSNKRQMTGTVRLSGRTIYPKQ